MDSNFLKTLLDSMRPVNQNDPDVIKRQIAQNNNDIQADWERKANDSLLRDKLSRSSAYPLSPLDPMRDQFGALNGILPGTTAIPAAPTGFNMTADLPQMPASAPSQMSPMAPPTIPKAIPQQNPDITSQAPEQAPQPMQENPQPEQPKGPSLEEMMAQLQGDRKNQLKNINLVEAADRIGQAIGGQGYLKYEPGRFESEKQLAQMDLSDFLDKEKFKKENTRFDLDTTKSKLDIEKAKGQVGDEASQRDPNSDISKLSREIASTNLNKIGLGSLAGKITNDLSFNQIENLFQKYSLANMVSQYEANESRKEMAALRASEKKDQAAAKEEQRKENFITQRYDKVLASPQYKGMTKITQARKVIDDALRNPNGITDIGALYSVIKLFDPDSVVREGELKLTDGAKSVWTQANTAISKLGKNPRILDKNVLAKMKQAADTIYGETIQQYKTEISPVLNQAKARGITEGEYGLIDPLYDSWKDSSSGMSITPDVQNKAMEELKRRQGK